MATKGQKLAAAATTLAIAEPVLVMAHTGALGVIVGLGLGLAAYHAVEDVERATGVELPTPARKPKQEKQIRASGKRSVLARMFSGKGARALDGGGEREDAYAEEDESYNLDLGPRLSPHVNEVLSHRLAILGMPGQGKSTAVTDLVEELGVYNMPLLILDHKPEYAALCDPEYLTNPYKAGADNVTLAGAYDFGRRIMDERLQVVLDLRSFGNDTLAAQVMIQILTGISTWQGQYVSGDGLPCMVFLEEAHYWLPQDQSMSTVSRVSRNGEQSVFAKLQHTFFTLVTGGRSLAIGTVMVTQRPADIDNRAINLADWKILFKADMPQDLKVYRALGAKDEEIIMLPVGHSYIKGPDIRGIYQWRERKSPDEAQTPGVESLSRVRALRPPEETTQRSSVALRATTQNGQILGNAPTLARNADMSNPPEERAQETQNDRHVSVMARNGETVRLPEERAQETQKYRLDAAQEAMFRVIYPNLVPSKDEALRRVGANTSYREHANEIIDQMRKGN